MKALDRLLVTRLTRADVTALQLAGAWTLVRRYPKPRIRMKRDRR